MFASDQLFQKQYPQLSLNHFVELLSKNPRSRGQFLEELLSINGLPAKDSWLKEIPFKSANIRDQQP